MCETTLIKAFGLCAISIKFENFTLTTYSGPEALLL